MNKEYYTPIVPMWIASILDNEKKFKNNPKMLYIIYGNKKEKAAWDKWKKHYSRKLKYARENGYIINNIETTRSDFMYNIFHNVEEADLKKKIK